MTRIRAAMVAACLTAGMVSMPALAQPAGIDPQALERMMAGESQVQGAALEQAISAAAAHPLGSRDNPVRAAMPTGQRAYLARLRCADGRAPTFRRSGNVGLGPYGNIIDLYAVTCAGGSPAETAVHMDMYHRGHVEDRAVPGFTIARTGAPTRPQPVVR